jgi:hypothetical protein
MTTLVAMLLLSRPVEAKICGWPSAPNLHQTAGAATPNDPRDYHETNSIEEQMLAERQ